MDCQALLLSELEHYGYHQLFIASTVYVEKFLSLVNETTYYKTLERFVKNKILYRLSKGIYCKIQNGILGIVPISSSKIAAKLIENNAGMYIGYHLYNRLGLTTQISKKIEVLITEPLKQKNIGIITVETIDIELNPSIVKTIEVLEVLKHVEKIQDLNILQLQRYLMNFALHDYCEASFEQTYQIRKYPKYVINALKQVLDYYQVEHRLNRYLSTLSKYKNMEILLYGTVFE